MGQGQCGSSHSGEHGTVSRTVAKKKALLIGINYKGSSVELRGCINDVAVQKAMLKEQFGFQDCEILVLTEDEPKDKWPTKARIEEGIKWLYEGLKAGDVAFFHYSGHGSQTTENGETCDCICPLGCIGEKWPEAVITDFAIHRTLFDPLPEKVKCVAVFDCCHSGTEANLTVNRGFLGGGGGGKDDVRQRYLQAPPEAAAPKGAVSKKGIRRAMCSGTYADHQFWVFGGCQDDQTSADAYENGQFMGAFTWAFHKALTEDVFITTYVDLLAQIKDNLKARYPQVPALSTTTAEYLNWYFLGRGQDGGREITEVPSADKKALLVGCNYRGKNFELKGCINDVIKQKKMLQELYGFKECDMLILTEDEVKENWPTKKRIQEGMEWLLNGAKEGDHLFLHFSGHGSQITDKTGHEPSGFSDVICPLDCDLPWPAHVIVDTEIHAELYEKLPNGVRLECVFDCCHSGTVANLDQKRSDPGLLPMVPQEYNKPRYLPPPQALSQPGSPSGSASPFSVAAFSCTRPSEGKKASGFRKACQNGPHLKDKLLFVFSGCQDNQTSADAFEENIYQGAFTWSFRKALESKRYSARHAELLLKCREILAPHYTQVPALSTTNAEYFQRYFLGQHTALGGFKTCGR